jgi:hypothetical protein
MSALGQKPPFRPGHSNVRFAPQAAIADGREAISSESYETENLSK